MDAPGPRSSIDLALERQEVVWLSSVRPDGRPHVVPVWFVWEDGSIVVVSKPGAQKVRNLRRTRARWSRSANRPGISMSS